MNRFALIVMLVGTCLPSALAAADAPTVWWRTTGGEVIEDTDPISGKLACSLYIYDEDRAAIISWRADEPAWLSISNPAWNFGETGRDVTLAVEIGDNWLDHGPTPNIRARGYKTVLTMPLSRPVEGLLQGAKQIRAVPEGSDPPATIAVNSAKMPALLQKGVDRCRKVLRARG